MAAIYREQDGQRIYRAKAGGETTDRKQAQKHRGCAAHAALREVECHGSQFRFYCDCGR